MQHTDYIALSVKVGVGVLLLGGLIGGFLKPARPICGMALVITSWIVGILIWLLCFGTVVDIWGMTVAVIGILMLGVGCLPMALIATAIHGTWGVFIEIAVGLIVIIGSRAAAAAFDSSGSST